MKAMENNIDKQVDDTLEQCILGKPRKSFFLFAGAGSGKTHSLVTLLKKIKDKIGHELLLQGKQIAVITFTNAATDEIINRLDYSNVFHISTIHSFVWDIIQNYQKDIKHYYCQNIQTDIKELSDKLEGTANKTTKTYRANEEKLNSLRERHEKAQTIDKFVYNPNGSNPEYNALKHAEVIKISAQMITENKMLQRLIAQRYPVLLIDESQDTKKELVDAFFCLQSNYADIFTLGLLGDQKQRIYTDGKEDMVSIIPESWAQPVKKMNYRCAKRIIKLANTIGKEIDEHAEQDPRADAIEGHVRLFIVNLYDGIDKDAVETSIMHKMEEISKDEKWTGDNADVKILTLEHLMAARRLGFANFYEPMAKVSKYQMTFLQGTVSELEFFTKEIIPIADSVDGDGSEALRILKAYSPLLDRKNNKLSYSHYLKCSEGAKTIANLVKENRSIREIVKETFEIMLLHVPEVVSQASQLSIEELDVDTDEELRAWVSIMDLPISMIRKYDDYVNQRTRFDTHQGVKGLEFERVMVIIDDSEARGFLFSYDKLFGVKLLTDTDKKNKAEGKETSIERTQRLFYVTCTRAKTSLAVVVYTSCPEGVKMQAINKQWFEEEEIELM